jgi:hypothetical protein
MAILRTNCQVRPVLTAGGYEAQFLSFMTDGQDPAAILPRAMSGNGAQFAFFAAPGARGARVYAPALCDKGNI